MSPMRIVIAVAFYFVISESGGAAVDAAAPVLYREPADELVRRNSPVTLFCKAAGSPPPAIRWYRSDSEDPLTNGAHRLLLPDGSLFFYRLRRRDAGTYYCTATNIHGTASSRHASVHIAYLHHDFRHSPEDIAVVEGKTVVLECSPPKGHPPPVVAWRRDDSPLSLPTLRSRQEDSQLIIEDVRPDDGGLYACSASNAAGARVSTPALLVVLEIPRAERVQPRVQVLEGSNVTLPCRPRGRPKPQVAWLRLDGAMPGGRATVEGEGNLVLREVRWEDEGVYACQLTSPAGTASANTSLHIVAPPRLTVYPPPSALLHPDHARVLPCIARGAPTPLVFWMREDGRNSEDEWPLVMSGGGRVDTAHVTPFDRALHLTAGDRDAVWVCMAVNEIGGTFAPVHVLSIQDALSISGQELPESSWLETEEENPMADAEVPKEVTLRKNATDAEILGLRNKGQVNIGEGKMGVVTLGEVQARRDLQHPTLRQERARSHAPSSAEVFWMEEGGQPLGVRAEGVFVLLCQRAHGRVASRLLANKTKSNDLDFDSDYFVDFGRSYDEAYYSPAGETPLPEYPLSWGIPAPPEDPPEAASGPTPNRRTQDAPPRAEHPRNRAFRRKNGWDFEWDSRAAAGTLPPVPEAEEVLTREDLEVEEDQQVHREGNEGSLLEEEEEQEVDEEAGEEEEEGKGEGDENPPSSMTSSQVRGRRHNVRHREEHRPSCRLSPFCVEDEVLATAPPLPVPISNPFGLPQGPFLGTGASESPLREAGPKTRNSRRPHTPPAEILAHPHPLPPPPPPLAPRSLQERSPEYPQTLALEEDVTDPEEGENDKDASRSKDTPRCTGLEVVARASATRGRHTLTGLQPFTTYWAVLVPFRGRVLGSPSNTMAFTTAQDVPAGWPDVTRWWTDGGGTGFVVTLHWRPPPLRLQRGIVSAYRIVMAERGGSWRVLHNVTVPGDQRSVTVPAVTAPTVQITLWALTEAGAGPPSPPLALDLLTSSRIPQEALHESKEDVWAWLLMLVAGAAFVLLIVVGVAMVTQRHAKRLPLQHHGGSGREDKDDPKARLRLLHASGNSTSTDYPNVDLEAANKNLMVSCSLSSPAASSHASSRSRLLRTPDCSSSTSQNTAIHRPTALVSSSPQPLPTKEEVAPSEQEAGPSPAPRRNSWSSCDGGGCRFCLPDNAVSAVGGPSSAGGAGGGGEGGAGKDRGRSGLRLDIGENGHDRCEFRCKQLLLQQMVPGRNPGLLGNMAIRAPSPADAHEAEIKRRSRSPSDFSLTTVTPISTLRRSSDEVLPASVSLLGRPTHPSPPASTAPTTKQRLFTLGSTTTDFSNEDHLDRVFEDDPTTCSDTEASFFIPTRSPSHAPRIGTPPIGMSDDFGSWRFFLSSLKDRSSNLPDTLGTNVLSRNVLTLNFDSAGNTLSDSDRHLALEPSRMRPIYPSTFMDGHLPGCGGIGPMYPAWRRNEGGHGRPEKEMEDFGREVDGEDPRMALDIPSQGIRRTTSSFGGAALSKLLLRRKIKRQARCRSDSSTSRDSIEDPFDRTLQFVKSVRRQNSHDSQEMN